MNYYYYHHDYYRKWKEAEGMWHEQQAKNNHSIYSQGLLKRVSLSHPDIRKDIKTLELVQNFLLNFY